MSTPFYETLRETNRVAWNAMQAHPFVRAIEENRLAAQAFRAYLLQEHDFVAAAIEIFALAVVKAPNFPARRHLIGVLHALAEEQMPYFDAAFAALGMAAEPCGSLPPSVIAFRQGMLGIARNGSYAEIVTAMLAAEWMYASWCARASARQISDPHLARWIALHSAPDFVAGVAWLKGAVEEEARKCDRAGWALLVRRFGEALTLEIGFHTAALSTATS